MEIHALCIKYICTLSTGDSAFELVCLHKPIELTHIEYSPLQHLQDLLMIISTL